MRARVCVSARACARNKPHVRVGPTNRTPCAPLRSPARRYPPVLQVFTSGLFPAEVRSLLFGALSNALLCATGGTTPLVLTWLCRSYVLAPAMVGTMLAGLGSVATAIAILMQRSGVQIDYHRRPDGPNAGGKRATPAEQESEATPCAVAGEGHSVKGTGQSEKTG